MFKPFGIFLLSLFLFSQVYNTAVWVNYELNIEVITEEFCENTDKPELNCLGSCHLKKQIITTDQSNPVDTPNTLYLNEIQLFPSSNDSELHQPLKNAITHNTYFGVSYSYLKGQSIFHPPQA